MKYARVEVDGTTRWGTVRDGTVQLLDGSPYDGSQPEIGRASCRERVL